MDAATTVAEIRVFRTELQEGGLTTELDSGYRLLGRLNVSLSMEFEERLSALAELLEDFLRTLSRIQFEYADSEGTFLSPEFDEVLKRMEMVRV